MNYYAILGVRPTASDKDIKKAYQKLAKLHHPDKNRHSPDAHHRFAQISKAHDTLSDPIKRAEYNASLNPNNGVPKENARSRNMPDMGPSFRQTGIFNKALFLRFGCSLLGLW